MKHRNRQLFFLAALVISFMNTLSVHYLRLVFKTSNIMMFQSLFLTFIIVCRLTKISISCLISTCKFKTLTSILDIIIYPLCCCINDFHIYASKSRSDVKNTSVSVITDRVVDNFVKSDRKIGEILSIHVLL